MSKRVLITGKNSYIGRSFIEYCASNNVNIEIEELDTQGEKWKQFDFSSFDTVVHLAGIAHIKETKENEHLYYKVNRDLAIDIAMKAKKNGVKHFIFMSTMSVYGLIEGHIDENTSAKPNTAYGKSKLQAENKIKLLNNREFTVSIVRPPMIYGPGSKGNYSLLSAFAKKTKIFPLLKNERSMIYIENLSKFLTNIIFNPQYKWFYPQNQNYVSSSDLVKKIALVNGNKVYFTSVFNPIIKLFRFNILKKVFGNLVYDISLSEGYEEYQVKNLEESIKKTESIS